MSNLGFHIDAKDVLEGLTKFEQKVIAATDMYANTVAKDFESYAKKNRPWKDRTSRARQGLTGYTEHRPNGVRINIAHTVDYGLWLEYARNKKYAILEPTVRLKSPEVIKAWEKHFG